MWILIAGLAALGVVAAIAGVVRERRLRRQLERGEIAAMPEVKMVTDCGADACPDEGCGESTCEGTCLVPPTAPRAVYYDDEELDAWKGIEPTQYTAEQEEQFREVFYTMQPADVPGWVSSLQARGVALPDGLKDEVWMVMREERAAAHRQKAKENQTARP